MNAATRAPQQDSHYTMTLRPEFVQNILAFNFKSAFDLVERMAENDKYLEDVDVWLKSVSFKIVAKSNKLPLDLTLDEETQKMHVDLRDLTIKGSATLKTKQANVRERVQFEVPLSHAQIVFQIWALRT